MSPGTLKTDDLIVGGGISGLYLARELGRAGRRCVVLEAGSGRAIGDWRDLTWFDEGRDAVELDTDHPYNAKLSWVKALGGGTEAWEGYTPRWVRADFQARSRSGFGADWPFGYDELEPYYERAERFLGVAGCADNPHDEPRRTPFPLPAFRFDQYEENVVSRATGFRWHHVPQARNSLAYGGRSHCNVIGNCNVCPIQARWTPSGTLLPEVRRLRTVRVMTDCVCLRLECDDAGRPVRAHVACAHEPVERVEFERVIVCAGAVESARLLLLSAGARHPRGLGNDSGLVGCGFMDHPVLRLKARPEWSFKDQRQTNILASSHDFRAFSPRDGAFGFLINLNSRDPGRRMWVAAHLEMPPVAGNAISLAGAQRDRHGRPVARLHVRCAYPGFQDTLQRCEQVLTEVVRSAGGREIAKDPFQLWACHPMGGLALGGDPASSVVGPDLAVWSCPNMFVLSLGVFCSGAAVNPTLTLLALGMRLAEHLGGKRHDA